MFIIGKATDPEENLAQMLQSAQAVLEGEDDLISGLSNLSAVLAAYLPDINWAGFYLLRGDTLVLGPFQGLPACTRILLGRGVCGTAAAEDRTVVVEDVHAFLGHIACDSASQSEIVAPIHQSGQIFGVLDIDSPKLDRFGAIEQDAIEQFVKMIESWLNSLNIN